MTDSNLNATACKVVEKTILAADESTATIKKRFTSIGVESTPELNRQYRQLLFTAPDFEKYVSGVILFDETIRQADDTGKPFAQLLADKGIVPGIKVDRGVAKLPEQGEDTFTQGFDDLPKRLTEYYALGARFAKWRAVYTIVDDRPSKLSIARNAHDLALYALLCQEAGIVPIVEPEVLMDGDNTIETDADVTGRVLEKVFKQLDKYGVQLDGIILKPNMVTPGKKCGDQKSLDEVAHATLKVLKENVPATVPGIAFLSGGQSPDLATDHLRAINMQKMKEETSYPWRVTASYGRALQGETIEAWGGKAENVAKAQTVFISRAQKVFNASQGK
jgi:fructose-bisphosphate aldolase, class I